MVCIFYKFHIPILRRPQNFAKSQPIIWLEVHRTNNWWRFRQIVWPSQNVWTLKRLTFVLQAVVFWKTTQVDIISQCTTQAGPIPCGKMAANRLKAITLAVIELKCHKNWKRPPFQCRFFFSGNVYLKLLWYTTKDQATEHKLDTIEITKIHFLMGKFVSKSVSKCVEFTTSGSLIRI